MNVRRLLWSMLCAGAMCTGAMAGGQISPVFTYQGVLKSSGAPYNGTADLRFTLFDAPSGGSVMGAPFPVNAVQVTGGLFSADLYVSTPMINGDERWLGIEVRTPSNGGAGPYTPLSGRQRLAPVPHAIVARNALHVAGEQTGAVQFNNSTNAFTGATRDIDSGTLHVDDVNNRVGIGIAAPVAHLHVRKGDSMVTPNPDSTLALENNWNNYLSMLTPDGFESGLIFGQPSAPNPTANAGLFYNTQYVSGGLEFRTGGNLGRMVIDSTGNVGIGTFNPIAPLHVVQPAGAPHAMQLGTIGDVPVSLSLNTPFHSWSIGQNYPWFVDNFVIREETIGATRFTIQNGTGHVGINTMNPLDMLTIEGTGTAISTLDNTVRTRLFSSFATGKGYVGTNTSHPFVLRTGGQDRLTIDTAGNVGIGVASPAHMLTVNGTAGKPGGGSWSTYSDARLKTNVYDLDGALDSLLALRGVTFEYKDPASINERPGEHIGMIAQEVEQVFPQWVSQQTPEGYKQLAFSGFEALTVEALRDLRAEKDAQIGALSERVAALTESNSQLQARLETLERLVQQRMTKD